MPSLQLKLTKAEQQELDCLCGLCDHTYLSRTCLFNKICEAKNPDLEQKRQIIKFIEKILKKQKNVNSIITPKAKKGKR